MEKGKAGKLSMNIILLGIVSLLNDLSSEMITPVLPFFITSLGGTGIAVGLIGGLRDSVASIFQIFAGYISDRTGKRKIFVYSGYLTSAIFKLMLFFSNIWYSILIFIGLERLGKGLRTVPRDAIISESTSHRGRGFGIHRAMDTLGAIFGSIIAFALIWFFNVPFKHIILAAAFLSLFSLIPIYFVKEKKAKPKKTKLRIGLKKLPKSLKLFIFISGIFAFANFSYMFFVLKAQQHFSEKLSIALPVLLYVLFNIFYASFSAPFGALSDKIGRKKVISSGYFLFFITSTGFIFFDSAVSFIILFSLYGLTLALIDANQRAFVSDLSSGSQRAIALGTFHTVMGLAAFLSSLIAGLLWQVNPIYTFIYGSIISLVSVIAFINWKIFGNVNPFPKQ